MQFHDRAELNAATDRISTRHHLTLSVLWFALNFQNAALLPIVLPIQILLFVAPGAVGNAQQATFLGWLATLGAVLALFMPALAGALSDRTTSSWGRRRPYIAFGAVLLLVGSSVLAVPRNIYFLLGGLLLFQLGNTICTGGYQGLLPDQVPENQRGEASGYIGLMTILGNAGSLGLAAVLLRQITASSADADAIRQGSAFYYTITGFILAACALITVFGVHEIPLDPSTLPPRRAVSFAERRRSLVAAWLEPWRHPNFRWVFLTRASVIMGLTLFLTFIEYYFVSVAHIPDFVQETAALSLLALLGAASTALVLGFLSDRIGRVWLVCGATACMGLAALAFVILPSIPLWPLGLLFGMGYGAYTSVDWALAVDVLPSRTSAGKDMGIWSIASNLPAILAPLAGSAAIGLASFSGDTAVGYRAVFALAVLCLLCGAVFILKVRDEIAVREQQAAVVRAQVVARHNVAPGWRLALGTGAGKARGFLRVWPIVDRITQFLFPTKRIPGATADFLRIHWRRYSGAPIELPDGTHIAPGDNIGDVHVNNRLLLATALRRSVSWELLGMPRSDLRALARWLADPANAADLRALYGVTLLGPIAARLGFTLRPQPLTVYTRLERFFMVGLLALYHPRGLARLTEGTTYRTYPVEIWMSRAELLRLYGENGSGDGGRNDASV